jgi:superfamily II DNA or RNA helicase
MTASLESLTVGSRVRGLVGQDAVTIQALKWIGNSGLQVVYRDQSGHLGEALIFRDREPELDVLEAGQRWSFISDGNLLRLVSEAQRIQLAWLFDPYVAVTTSQVDPLPHQISAVYEQMLSRQPLRFLLADDPGAGKTIMAGLLIKELLIRGDLQRGLIVAPGSLTEQWQDELADKFGLEFEILTRDQIEASRTANPFEKQNLLIVRMDQLSRNEDLQQRLLDAPEWDLVVVDEAHRMSGHYLGGEIKLTKRYRLGQLVARHCRHFLLMTATPHNGKEEDFQIFLALIDGDRFEGRFREGVHKTDSSDLMRRMIKEDLLTFEGKPLFPERRSYTAQYELSEPEAYLYSRVTDYVREEMNRADRLAAEGEAKRRVNVGFALMTLQRRLASSPEAIFKSLTRRRERLEARLREERLQLRGRLAASQAEQLDIDPDELEEETPQAEREAIEQQLTDNATASRTIEELAAEIDQLKDLEKLAKQLLTSGQDAKWLQLDAILNDPLMLDQRGYRRKLVIFSEFKDTLSYLAQRIRQRLGRVEAVVEIHGSVTREERRKVVNSFMNDPEVLVLIANDAAGEGVNLQRSHLMVNYDLPWNPNRLEQRFGRIHRIGQKEVCHLWNLVAKDTREGEVYLRLLDKLAAEQDSLGGKVFDVLGQLFEDKALRLLLEEAIRYGNDPRVKAKLEATIDGALDRKHLEDLLARRALVHSHLDTLSVAALRDEMERAEARRLQPHFIQAFFLEGFTLLGGKVHRRERGRWEISHVPSSIRERDRQIGTGAPVANRYERICFEKAYVSDPPRAEFICPGHPLLSATLSLILERYRDVLQQGSILIDESDPGTEPRLLFYLEQAIQDGRKLRNGQYQEISRQLQFVEVDRQQQFRAAGSAPYLDYRPLTQEEQSLVLPLMEEEWLRQDWDEAVLTYCLTQILPDHLEQIKRQRLSLVDKVETEVKARLQREINYWYRRYEELKLKEQAGKETRLPAQVAKDRSQALADRLQQRLAELARERSIAPKPPQIKGGALILPVGLLRQLKGNQPEAQAVEADPAARQRVEQLAMAEVLAAERQLGRAPRDVSAERGLGYDIESRDMDSGTLYFIEVKGRIAGADSVTLTVNEVRRALNVPERFRLAIVQVEGDQALPPVYVPGQFNWGQPGFGQTQTTYGLAQLLAQGQAPH